MTDFTKIPDTMLPQVKQQTQARLTALESALTKQQEAFAQSIKVIENNITEAKADLTYINTRLKV